jgi:hypothetical protein
MTSCLSAYGASIDSSDTTAVGRSTESHSTAGDRFRRETPDALQFVAAVTVWHLRESCHNADEACGVHRDLRT